MAAKAERIGDQTVESDDVERAVAQYLSRDGYELVGDATSFSGSRAVLTVRKGRAVFAVHVFPAEPDDNLVR